MEKAQVKKINNNNRKRGAKFEKTTADFLGMVVVPYSGSNARFGYGDIRDDESIDRCRFLGECKNISSADDRITIKIEWISKNRERASKYNLLPFIAFMRKGSSRKWILFEIDMYNEILSKCTYDIPLIEIIIPTRVHNVKNLILDEIVLKANLKYRSMPNLSQKFDRTILKMKTQGTNKWYYIVSIEIFNEYLKLWRDQ